MEAGDPLPYSSVRSQEVFMKFKRTAATAAAIMLGLLIMLFSACTEPTAVKVKVTFDYNDGFTSERVEEIESGATATKPTDPERDGFVFVCWSAAGNDTAYDFTSPVTADLTLRAKWEVNEHTVIFFVYDGETSEKTVIDGETLSEPDEPERENYVFDGWYVDETTMRKYNFSSPVTADMTLYAKWREKDAQYFAVTFDPNYEGAPTAAASSVKQGDKAIKPVDPSRGGYTFKGWFMDTACAVAYDFNAPITADTRIYAGWEEVAGSKNYKFEAELTDISGLKGSGYSNEAEGKSMVQRDVSGKSQASNGFWMGFLYIKGCALTFEFESKTKVTDATLKLRLSAEFVNELLLKSSQFTVRLNGVGIDYNDIRITDIDPSISAAKRAFQDFTVGENLTLEAGRNTIVLTVDNNTPLTGTNGVPAGGKIQATAPLVDCIKITTAATLSWTPYTEALEDRFGWDADSMYEGIVEDGEGD